MTIHLFFILRIPCEPLEQGGLFDDRRSPTRAIRDSILSMPETIVRGETVWHIGAPKEIKEDGIAFQLGRVHPVNSPQFDRDQHVFFEADSERAPYTWGVFDERHQSCAILKKSGVSGNPREIARRLERLLNASPVPRESGFRIVVDELYDPQEFIQQLQGAHRITKFSFTAEFENPFDVSNLIHRPAEKFNELVGGDRTKVEVEGDDLNRDVLEELTRSVVSVGDDAAATVRPGDGSKRKRIFTRGTPLVDEFDDEEGRGGPFSALLSALRASYDRLRNSAR